MKKKILLLIAILLLVVLFAPLPRKEHIDCSPCVEGQICPPCPSERWELGMPWGIKWLFSILKREEVGTQEKLSWEEPSSLERKSQSKEQAKTRELRPEEIRIIENEERALSDITFEMEIDSMIGGGIMGATNIDVINDKGEVYKISSPSYQDEQKKELIKQIDKELLDSLRNSLIKANIFKMETGGPQYGGQKWRVVIDGQEKTIYFLETPGSLLETERILEKILEKNLD